MSLPSLRVPFVASGVAAVDPSSVGDHEKNIENVNASALSKKIVIQPTCKGDLPAVDTAEEGNRKKIGSPMDSNVDRLESTTTNEEEPITGGCSYTDEPGPGKLNQTESKGTGFTRKECNIERIMTDEEFPDEPPTSAWEWSSVLNFLVCCRRNPEIGNNKIQEIIFDGENSLILPTSHTCMRSEEALQNSNFKSAASEKELKIPVVISGPATSLEFGQCSQNRKQKLLKNCAFEVSVENLYFNSKKWREAVMGDLNEALTQQAVKYLPSKATLILSSGPECLSILKFQDISVGISILNLHNCSLGFFHLAEIMLRCQHLIQITISMSDYEYSFYRYQIGYFVGTEDDEVTTNQYQKSIIDMVANVKTTLGLTQPIPKMLKRIKLHFPYIKACTVACFIINAVYGDSLELEEFEISFSQTKMINTLIKLNPDQAEIVKEALNLDCSNILKNSYGSLKKLSFASGDKFPLDWLKATLKNDLRKIIHIKYKLSYGLLFAVLPSPVLPPVGETPNRIFTKLEELNLSLPLLKIVTPYCDYEEKRGLHDLFSRFLNSVEAFIASHLLKLKKLNLEGIRTERVMFHWMKEHFYGPQCNTSFGVTFNSSELKKEFHDYHDEITSLALILDNNTSDVTINSVINPQREKKNTKFPSVRTLHIVNQLETLQSFSTLALVEKFHTLTTLVIEDYTYNKDFKTIDSKLDSTTKEKALFTSKAKISNSDLKNIILKLSSTLRILHLDCNLTEITDDGITGYTGKKNWSSVKNSKDVFSFSLLSGIRYLYLRGLGDHVTDVSAKLCFGDILQFKRLRELHLFAPKITAAGKDLIRDRFSGHRDFILELD